MSKAWKAVVIVVAIVVGLAVAIHLVGGPLLASLAQSIHGRP